MSIYAIRNQPFQFGSNLYPRSLALMCCADDPVPSLIAATDEVWAQATLTQCGAEDGIVISGGPDGWDDWVAGDGFFLSGTSYVLAAPTPGTSLYILENAVAGTQYTIQLEVADVTGTAYVIFGGVQSPNLSDGLNEFLITANSASPFELIVDSGTITVNSVIVTSLNTDVSAIFHQGSTELVFDQSDYPDNFYFFNGGFTFHMPMSTVGITEGCFTLELRDNCSDTGMTSQVFRIVDANCETFLIRACNDYDNIGFVVPFVPRIRIPASMGWPSYNTDVQEERHSDGKIFRPYGDRTRTMTIKTEILNEFDHAFLSTLPIWDHVYIGAGVQAQEVVVNKGKYEPLYGEGQNLNGAVVFDVSPKAELVRKVQCGPDLSGCAPMSDPQCIGSASYAYTFNPSGSGYNLELTIAALSNITPSTASITVADGAPVVQTVGTLPSVLTWGPLPAGAPLTLRIFDAMNQNCVITKFFDVPEEPEFVCEEPETASIVVAPGGGTKVFVSGGTSTHFTIRGPSQTYTWPVNAPDGIEIGQGPWCIYASDSEGNQGGSIHDIQLGMYEGNDLLSVDLSRMNDLMDVYMILIGPATTFTPFNGDLKNFLISGAALISVLPSFSNIDGLQSFSIDSMSVLSALPDFSPDALASLFIHACPYLAGTGTLPKVSNLDIADTGITDPAVVDALVNALHPASSGIATFNGLLALRTSASDTNYNACISAGWTFI